MLASKAFVVDACRHVVRDGSKVVSLTRRPVLFALALAWAKRGRRRIEGHAVARAFGSTFADESHRAAASRNRAASPMLRTLAGVMRRRGLRSRRAAHAKSSCWRGPPHSTRKGAEHAAVLASHRRRIVVEFGPCACPGNEPAHRAAGLDSLAAAGTVQSFGRGRARRWMTPPVTRIHDDLVTPAPCRLSRVLFGGT